MAGAEKSETENQKNSMLDQSEKTILVVEDDATHRTLMEKILNSSGFSVASAENGFIALSKLEAGQKFDLIIMDWDMPGLDGLETVKIIREQQVQENRTHTPVIAFTANKSPGDREKCLAAGMDAYLPKDVWMPKWRQTLIDSLPGLIAGKFDTQNFDGIPPDAPQENAQTEFDLDAFNPEALEQAAALLKDELGIAVDEYLEDAAAYIRDIKEGLESGDAEKAARGSHPLKSNSKSFGLTAVSEIAEAINILAEKARRGDGALEPAQALLPQLQEAFNKADKRLREAIKNAAY